MATTNVVNAATKEESAPTEDPLLKLTVDVTIDEHPKIPEAVNTDVDHGDRVTRESTSPKNEPSPRPFGKNRKKRCCPYCSAFKSTYGYIGHIKSCKKRPAEISAEQAVLDAADGFDHASPPRAVQEERKCPLCLAFSTKSAGAYVNHVNACIKKQQPNQEEVPGTQTDEEPKAQTTTKNIARNKKCPHCLEYKPSLGYGPHIRKCKTAHKKQPDSQDEQSDVATSYIPREKILKQCPHCKEKKSPYGFRRHVESCSRKSSLGHDYSLTESEKSNKKQPDSQDEQSDVASSHVVPEKIIKLCPHCKEEKSPFGFKRHVWSCSRTSSLGHDHSLTESEKSNKKQADSQDEHSDVASSHVVLEKIIKLCPHCKEEKSPFGFKRHVWSCSRKSSLGHDHSLTESEKSNKKQPDSQDEHFDVASSHGVREKTIKLCPHCKKKKSPFGFKRHVWSCSRTASLGHDHSLTESEKLQMKQCPICLTWKSCFGIISHIKACKKKHGMARIKSSDDEDNNNMDENPEKQPRQRKRKFTQFFNPDPYEEQQLKRQHSNSALASNDGVSETKVATNSIRVTNCGQTWTTGDECMMLLIALDNPKRMIESGAGVWMLGAMNNSELSGESIATHWAEMLNRIGENGSRALASTSTQTTAIHVMAACFAAVADEAKSVALLSAGWQYSPPATVSVSLTTSKRRERPKSVELMAQKNIWGRPRPITSPTRRSKSSRRDRVKSLLSLEEAWTEHINELREGIEAGLPPRKSIKNSESANKTETPYLETGDDDTRIASRTDDLSIGSSIESETEKVPDEDPVDRNEEIENTNDIRTVEILVKSSGFLKDLDESQISKTILNTMKTRRQYVIKGDPRPNMNCAWCGPKSMLEKEAKKSPKQVTLCSACHLLMQNGWMTNNVDKASPSKRFRYTFIGPDGERTRSIKEFVSMSSEQVVKLLPPEKVANEMQEEGTEMSEGPKIPQKGTTAQSRKHRSLAGSKSDTGTKTIKPSHAPLKERRHSIHCPSIHEVLELEEGLSGLLRDDEFRMFNRHYGSDANIALYMLSSLAKGVLPMEVLDETPFFRSDEELNILSPTGGAPPTRFIGVTRVVEDGVNAPNQIGANRSSGKFGVAFPRFEVDYAKFDGKKKTPLSSLNGSIVNGRSVLLRKDIEREDVAGQLYAFSIRLLYGKKAVEEILKETNDIESRIDILHDTLNAFGAVRLRHEKVHSDDAEKNVPGQSQENVAASTYCM
eukprot:scaffold44607_cov49-Attheya_sp.AAC.2